jgi:uncharacterized membrane protein YbhN (UPF0104 family)
MMIKRYVPILLLMFLLALFVVYVWRNADTFGELLNVSESLLVLAPSLVLLNFFGSGLINLFVYRNLGAPVTVVEALSLSAVNTLANLLPFAGGMVAKGVYLKRKFQLGYTRFLSATMALFVIMVATSGAIGLATLVYRSLRPGHEVSPLLLSGFAVMLLSVAVLWLPPSLVPRGRWALRFGQFLEGWRFMRRQPGLLALLLLLQLGLMFVLAGRYWTAFHLMSQPVTFTDCLLFAAGTTLTQLVTITPDGLGIREGIVGGIAALLGFDLGVSVVAVTIDRLVSTALILAFGSAASYHLARRLGGYSVVDAESKAQ